MQFQITRHFREKLWAQALRKTARSRHGREPVPYCSPQNRRLQADLEIQDILIQYVTIILGQVYMLFYRYSTFDTALNDEIYRIYKRLLIGLGIEFVFAWLSVFVQVCLYNIAIKTVWFRHWLRHILANLLILVVFTSYFSPVMLSIFQLRMESSVHVKYRNCTTSFIHPF